MYRTWIQACSCSLSKSFNINFFYFFLSAFHPTVTAICHIHPLYFPSISSSVFVSLMQSSLQFLMLLRWSHPSLQRAGYDASGRTVSMLILSSKQTQACFAEHNIWRRCCITIPAIWFLCQKESVLVERTKHTISGVNVARLRQTTRRMKRLEIQRLNFLFSLSVTWNETLWQ